MTPRKLVRAALLALIALAAVATLLRFLTFEPQAAPISKPKVSQLACASGEANGVTVIVEFQQKSRSFCVEHQNQTGWQLLNQISAEPQGTEQYPSGFVCKLFGYPNDQDCKDTPTATEGSWNYFFATAEQPDTWIYSVTGAGIRKPKCGDAEAWVFAEASGFETAAPPVAKPQTTVCE